MGWLANSCLCWINAFTYETFHIDKKMVHSPKIFSKNLFEILIKSQMPRGVRGKQTGG